MLGAAKPAILTVGDPRGVHRGGVGKRVKRPQLDVALAAYKKRKAKLIIAKECNKVQ